MLCKDKITAIFCIIDDILKEIYPVEDKRRKISDSEVILTSVLAAKNFYGNHSSAIRFVKEYGLIPNMLEESRFNRRLHQLGGILIEIFEFIASYFKEICCQMEYIMIRFLLKFVKIFASIVPKLFKASSGGATRQVCEPISMGLRFS